jgi:hypothetical protein
VLLELRLAGPEADPLWDAAPVPVAAEKVELWLGSAEAELPREVLPLTELMKDAEAAADAAGLMLPDTDVDEDTLAVALVFPDRVA